MLEEVAPVKFHLHKILNTTDFLPSKWCCHGLNIFRFQAASPPPLLLPLVQDVRMNIKLTDPQNRHIKMGKDMPEFGLPFLRQVNECKLMV
jgi:hypothetical protein